MQLRRRPTSEFTSHRACQAQPPFGYPEAVGLAQGVNPFASAPLAPLRLPCSSTSASGTHPSRVLQPAPHDSAAQAGQHSPNALDQRLRLQRGPSFQQAWQGAGSQAGAAAVAVAPRAPPIPSNASVPSAGNVAVASAATPPPPAPPAPPVAAAVAAVPAAPPTPAASAAPSALAKNFVYVYDGQKYSSLEEVQAAIAASGNGPALVPAEQSNAKASAGAAGKQWQAALVGARQQVQRINSLLDDLPKLQQLVLSLFATYVGLDRRLQQHEAYGLMMSLGVQIGVSNPTQVFGDVEQLFYRFDFSGDEELDEAETEQLIKFVLRQVRDRLAPPAGVKLVDLPRKDLDAEFQILKRLGQGGQGTVFLAEDKAAGRNQRVVKAYSKVDVNAPLDSIKEEFALLKQLDHPRIARVLDIFEDPGSVYVVSEPYFGGDLTTLVTKASEHGVTPTTTWVGGVFKQIIEGVAYLHQKRIMHCDLKETNVMIANDSDWGAPQVVIIDFDQAKDFGGEQAGGTPGYMPPEVWERRLWTPKGDIFSLAMLFWSVFMGKTGGPFLTDDAPPYMRIRANTIHMPIDCTGLPSGLRELTECMASKSFRHRPSAKALLSNSFFEALEQRGVPLSAEGLLALKQAAAKKSIQNLVAHELLKEQNLGQMRCLKDTFQSLDLDNDGFVREDEARVAFASLGLETALVDRIISALAGKDGTVQYSDFMAKLFLAQRGVTSSELAVVFASLDKDGNGLLDRSEVEELLTRPHMARLMEGRSVDSIIREMDRNGDGVIDFSEFQRAMLGDDGDVWAVGDVGRYYSRTHNTWLPCKILAVEPTHGAVMIDIKAGAWLSRDEQDQSLTRSYCRWSPGDACLYRSATHGQWLDAKVESVDADSGCVTIDLKRGCWIHPWQLRRPRAEAAL